jgi:hypothetical protein
MKKINAPQLAFLLGIPKVDANKKIFIALGGDKEKDFDRKETYSMDIKNLSKNLGVDLEFYIKDINKNFLKNQATGSFILSYPAKKLKPSKKTGLLPKSVAIPTILKSFFSNETIEEIKKKWYEKYAFEVKEHGIIFK